MTKNLHSSDGNLAGNGTEIRPNHPIFAQKLPGIGLPDSGKTTSSHLAQNVALEKTNTRPPLPAGKSAGNRPETAAEVAPARKQSAGIFNRPPRAPPAISPALPGTKTTASTWASSSHIPSPTEFANLAGNPPSSKTAAPPSFANSGQIPAPNPKLVVGKCNSTIGEDFPPLNLHKKQQNQKTQVGDLSSKNPATDGCSTCFRSELVSGQEDKNTRGVETELLPPAGDRRPPATFSGNPSPASNGQQQKSYRDATSGNAKGRLENFGTIDITGDIPIAVFTKTECDKVCEPLKLALVGKFSFGKPTLQVLRSNLKSLGVRNVQYLNSRHVLILFDNEEMLSKMWLKREINIVGYPMRIFRWSHDFNFKHEPAIIPVWIKIPGLPVHWFDHRALRTVANLVGPYIATDAATANKTRLNFARVCVEHNLEHPKLQKIGVKCGDQLIELDVEYEKLPKYCTHCRHVGHDEDLCYIKNIDLKPKILAKTPRVLVPPPVLDPDSIGKTAPDTDHVDDLDTVSASDIPVPDPISTGSSTGSSSGPVDGQTASDSDSDQEVDHGSLVLPVRSISAEPPRPSLHDYETKSELVDAFRAHFQLPNTVRDKLDKIISGGSPGPDTSPVPPSGPSSSSAANDLPPQGIVVALSATSRDGFQVDDEGFQEVRRRNPRRNKKHRAM